MSIEEDVPEHEYKMIHGDFGWHSHGQLLYLASEVALLVDRSIGEGSAILVKHGRPEVVADYQDQLAGAFKRMGRSPDLLMIKSRSWDLEELHKIIFNSGYINLWLRKHYQDEKTATRKTPLFAGVGPRSIGEENLHQLEVMTRLGAKVRELGGYLRSGHSGDCDLAFEDGARERTIAYLPYRGFNKRRDLLTKHVSVLEELDAKIKSEAIRSVVELHPSRGQVKQRRTLLCLARNYLIVMGQENTPVDGVIFWGIPQDEHGNVKGGTGQTVRFAMSRGVPCYNLYNMNEKQMMSRIEGAVASVG